MYSDSELIDGIRKRDNDVLRFIYKEYYPSIQYLINSNHGSDEAAKDVFQDIIIVIYSKIQKNELTLHCSFRTFLYAIGRNLWLKQLNIKRRWNMIPIDDSGILIDDGFEEIEILDVDDLKKLLYQKHFLRLNNTCQKILEMVIKKHPYKDIADRLNLKNEQYARKRKYRCIQSLIKSIQEDPSYKNLIKNEI